MIGALARKFFGSANDRRVKGYQSRVNAINALEPEVAALSDEALKARTEEFRKELAEGKTLDDILVPAFATVREAAKRTLGQRHFDVQLIGGMVLHDGDIAEMKTGEGKTLTATLAVVLNSIGGDGVHVGILQNMQAYADKQVSYGADVTYGTNSEFGFDYLRDNMAKTLEEKVQHGGRQDADGKRRARHVYAIVDEVDNILIDEARTPLIISGAPEQAADLYKKF